MSFSTALLPNPEGPARARQSPGATSRPRPARTGRLARPCRFPGEQICDLQDDGRGAVRVIGRTRCETVEGPQITVRGGGRERRRRGILHEGAAAMEAQGRCRIGLADRRAQASRRVLIDQRQGDGEGPCIQQRRRRRQLTVQRYHLAGPGRRPFPGDQFGLKRRYEGLQQSGLPAFVLEQGIKGGHQLGLAAIPAGDVAVADRPIAKLHGASAHRHLAETESFAATAGVATHHDQAGLGLPQALRYAPCPSRACSAWCAGAACSRGAAHRLPHRPRNQVQRQSGHAGPCAEPPRPRTTTGPTTKLAAELLGLTAAARVAVLEMLGNADGYRSWSRACTCLRHCSPVSRSA